MSKVWELLGQQSTWKAIVVLAGVVGYQWAPERVGEIITAVGVLYSVIAAFWDHS